MKTVDWIIHAVFDEKRTVFHTHDAKKYCGLEIELNLSATMETGKMILNTVVMHCSETKTPLKDGITLEKVFSVPIKVVKMKPIHGHDYKEDVYRIIVPDENGKFPGDVGCLPGYDAQLIPADAN